MKTGQKIFVKGYSEAGASHVRRALKGFIPASGAPSEDIDFNNKTLRQRARLLYMAAPVAAAAINTNRTKIVGSGLRMRCAPYRELLGLSDAAAVAWQKRTEAEWRLWAESAANCDAAGLHDFYGLQQLALKSELLSGDAFAALRREEATARNPYTLRLQLIEADRVSTPPEFGRVVIPNPTTGKNSKNGNMIFDGVEVDKNGRVVAYYICNVYPEQLTAEKAVWRRVTVCGRRTGLPHILQLMDAERPEQYRGVPYLAPVIETILQMRRYTESELVAALVQSYLTAWVTTQADPTELPFNEVGDGNLDGHPDDDAGLSTDDNEYEMGPGTINVMKPGESVTLGNPNVPTAGFETFVRTICRITGCALELPYDVLMKEFNASYSAAKGALEEAWETFKMRRAWFIADFCRPVYETWLAEAVAAGRIHAPGFFDDPLLRAAWSGARWDGPAQTHLDPLKDANANLIAVQNGWKTNEQVTRESYGGNWAENVIQRKAELAQAAL